MSAPEPGVTEPVGAGSSAADALSADALCADGADADALAVGAPGPPAGPMPGVGSRSAALPELWSPRSVAVVGASDNPAKWGHWLASGALAGREVRDVRLVNRSGTAVCGVPTLRSLREADGSVELAAIAVPAPAVEEAVIDALDAGARVVLVITDGLHRVPGRPGLVRELADRVTASGARLAGPSSLGIVDTSRRLRLAWGRFTEGPVAVITQSGQVGSELAHLLAGHGCGVSRFASVGVQADIGSEELLAGLVDDPATRAVISYTEGVRDPAAFLAAARALRAAGKPLVVLAVGTSAAGSAAARTHTGALTGSMEVLDAACRAAGAIRAETPAHAAALAHALALGVRPRGRRVAVVSDSGGQGALAADVATAHGLALPPLEGAVLASVGGLLPHVASPQNPVDLAGAGEQNLCRYAELAEAVATGADAVLLTGYFGRYGEDNPGLAEAEREVARRLARVAEHTPVTVHSMARSSAATRALAAGGVPVFGDVALAARVLADCAAWTAARPRALPAPAVHDGAQGDTRGTTHDGARDRSRRDTRGGAPAAGTSSGEDYLAAREVLRRAGIAVPDAASAASAAEAVRISGRWPGRTVLKAAGLAHKTEAGGVVLGLRNDVEIAAAYHELTGRLGVDSLVVEEMDERPGVVEVIAGVGHDPGFGPVVLVGAGGVAAELWRDTVVELAPVTEELAAGMLSRLRCHPLLLGWRGAPRVDLAALARAVAAVSRIPFTDPGITACEINPLRAAPDGVLAVDALVTRNDQRETPS
ncbi:acetate--CoA ligase family protein [Streptomyces sp. SYSU K21746]